MYFYYDLWMQESLNKKLNISSGGSDNPWFFFGISYSGALSAWFRLKFPHLTCGSLASSAVVRAIYEFSEFDQQVYILVAQFSLLSSFWHEWN